MTDRPDGQFRGRIPGSGVPPAAGAPGDSWGWNRVAEDRRRVPLLGIFLVLFGGILIVEQLFPAARALGSAVVVGVGLSLLVSWALDHQVWRLYAGALLTAVSLPSLLQDLNVISDGPGWGTLFLGIAFLAIALIRAGSRAGMGWQLIVGAILTVIGGAQVAEQVIPNFPSLERLVWPALILVLGVALVLRSSGRRSVPPGRG